jgi:serine/threonine protein kinase
VFEAGDVVAGHTVDTYLGGGSAADVYRARRNGEGAPAALKVLHTDATNDDRARERFIREFTIASMLRHPHIVATYEQGEIDSHPPVRSTSLRSGVNPAAPSPLWMTMQYVDGPESSLLIPRDPAEPDIEAVVRVSEQIAGALDYAHSQDVLHRDVKPANILLARDRQRAFLTDFGIAQLVDDAKPLAHNGRIRGSVAYASPELLQAQQLSPATDLYGLACTMFEWLTGSPPYPRADPFAITYAHIRGPVPLLTTRRPWLAFNIALDPSALGIIFTWGMIVACQLKLYHWERKGILERPKFRLPGTPYTGYATLVFLVAVTILMCYENYWNLIAIFVIGPMLVIGWYAVRGKVMAMARVHR